MELVSDFVSFIKELNKATEGILYIASGFLLTKGWDYLYKLYENRYKHRILQNDMDKYLKQLSEATNEEEKLLYRQKLTTHNAVYFALMNRDYVDPKLLLTTETSF